MPNDPRGSSSYVIRCDLIAELGDLHYGRKQVQPAAKDIRIFYERARSVLKFPLIEFDAIDWAVSAEALARVIAQQRYTCYACALMPDHMHLLLRKHRDPVERMIELMQGASGEALAAAGRHPRNHLIWSGPGWKVFQDCPEDICRTIRYVENNPLRQHLPGQQWRFVTPYDFWPLHKRYKGGHPRT